MRKLLLLALLCPFLTMCQPLSLKGKIVGDSGEPIPYATVTNMRNNTSVSANQKGEFSISNLHMDDTLLISAVGYNTQTEVYNYPLTDRDITITLTRKLSLLDEAVVIAYGTTTRRLSTSSVSKVTASDIARQPVSNPLSSLEGLVPGLLVTQSSGLPGAGIKVELRGRSSIAQGSDPLYIIDGIPYAPGNNSISSGISSALPSGNASPFSSINPLDIESIEVLKDADATAIYGSRGANGVVLITTKKAKAGKTAFSLSANTGWSRVSRKIPFLNTKQYLSMRREAFQNDNASFTAVNSYDLFLFDTTRYTDFVNYFIGGTARTENLHASLSGGTAQTRFTIGAGYDRQTTVFPGSLHDGRTSMHTSLVHQSIDNKFSLQFSSSYSYEDNNLSGRDLTQYVTLAPDWFSFFDNTGALVWQYGGFNFDNPMSYLKQTYRLQTYNLLSSLNLSYRLTKGLSVKTDLGYGRLSSSELRKIPKGAQLPGSMSQSIFGASSFSSWSVEPQLLYNAAFDKHSVDAVLGGSFQDIVNQTLMISGFNYVNDALLGSLAAAGTIGSKSNSSLPYRYAAGFARVQYRYNDEYLLTLSGRRDGSSRFGEANRFADFGALGLGWIFTKEALFKNNILSFGKLRGSYGTAGNDKIGDYKYLESWSPANAYQGLGTLYPVNLYNPSYGWEVNRKLEAAIDLGLFSDRLLLSASRYQSCSSNQLVQYSLPSQTGFTSIVNNFPAEVENRGWEIELTAHIIRSKVLSWQLYANITLPHNRLLSFPGIASSSYSNLVVGQPLSVYGGFQFMGVDPATGVYLFSDKDGKPTSTPSETTDWIKNLGNLDPKYYGGLKSTLEWKGFSLDLLFDFRKQPGLTWLYQLASKIPGTINNLPTDVLNHWTRPGDLAAFPMYTQSPTGAVYQSASTFSFYNNSGKYGDASFIRLRNVQLSYELSRKLAEKMKMEGLSLYLRGENLHTFTRYKGFDPESQSISMLPPLRTITAGITLNF